MISVVILTKDEEINISTCLKSVGWSDDIHVLDSGSTDRTVEIARDFGVRVWTNHFVSFAKQRNFALESIDIQHEWVLFLDADEVATPEFHREIKKAVKTADSSLAGFYCCWKLMLEGKWLKHCDTFPKWQFRLVRKGVAKFVDVGHGQKEGEVNGKIEYIKEPYLHYSFSKGWSEWIVRHNKYSSQEAAERLYSCPPFQNMFSSHPSIRNPALKGWLSKLAIWPLIRFCQAYFINLGFIEGVPGFIYCTIYCFQEFTILIKMRELRRNKNILLDQNLPLEAQLVEQAFTPDSFIDKVQKIN